MEEKEKRVQELMDSINEAESRLDVIPKQSIRVSDVEFSYYLSSIIRQMCVLELRNTISGEVVSIEIPLETFDILKNGLTHSLIAMRTAMLKKASELNYILKAVDNIKS